ncbi:MAG TPA: hypothetical protein VLX28_18250 [Thermoanaerobaculia bacterium]|nr:hypothetical protein [Thermoanaerobaculia bacterium]
MTFSSFRPSGSSRRAAAALLLSATLALTCAPPSYAWGGFRSPTTDGPERTAPEGGIFHFLLRMFGFVGGVMDPNGNQ